MALTGKESSTRARELLAGVPVIAVLEIERVEDAAPLARALIAGGLPILEVTLRTPVALDAIAQMKTIKNAVVGAGTVLRPKDAIAARAAGADFAVSPGASDGLIDACEAEDLPLLAGIATPSEAMAMLARGYDFCKFFPSESIGGVALLSALNGPLPMMSFCPTGGISAALAPSYLSLPNVMCVGGSWVAPKQLIKDKAWGQIEDLARDAARLAIKN